ncbi:hypothetical protein AMELA_G00206640 [Ameiurus melas]|uniref:Uncharacterized protein n=1 Tax=Ameiurus melas TaxID=219545 RepID=A0A7J6A3J9_AMEME|nr:hypothetical protein AMELA_G00206640 [Ameiurus melas]
MTSRTNLLPPLKRENPHAPEPLRSRDAFLRNERLNTEDPHCATSQATGREHHPRTEDNIPLPSLNDRDESLILRKILSLQVDIVGLITRF